MGHGIDKLYQKKGISSIERHHKDDLEQRDETLLIRGEAEQESILSDYRGMH